MTQFAFKVGLQTVQDRQDGTKLEVVDPDVTALDATVAGITGNNEVCRIIFADNATLDAENLSQTLQYLRKLLEDEAAIRERIQG